MINIGSHQVAADPMAKKGSTYNTSTSGVEEGVGKELDGIREEPTVYSEADQILNKKSTRLIEILLFWAPTTFQL